MLAVRAGAALGDLRAYSAPASLAARQTLRLGSAYRLVVGCELVAAVRALRRRGLRPDPGLPVGRAFELAGTVLQDEAADRPLTDDVTAAAALLDRFSDLVNDVTTRRAADPATTDPTTTEPTRGIA